jgi:monomeric isocitrate dehydrogenase
VNELDNRASNFYISLYWAELMAMKDPTYQDLATKLKDNRKQVVAELKLCQVTHRIPVEFTYVNQ